MRPCFKTSFLILAILCVGCDSTTSPSFTSIDIAAFKQQTGLALPDNAEILNYSSGWDERFLKLRMSRNEVASFIAAYPVQMVQVFPNMDGMEPSSVKSWWHPREVQSFTAFDGQFTWKTRALGGVSVLVESGATERPVVYVYVFKS